MSGGSLDYLYRKRVPELFHSVDHLTWAAAVAYNAGYKDIAQDIFCLAKYIISAKIRVNGLHEQLRDVLHAIEWYLSADYDDNSLCKALNAYRAGKPAEEG